MSGRGGALLGSLVGVGESARLSAYGIVCCTVCALLCRACGRYLQGLSPLLWPDFWCLMGSC